MDENWIFVDQIFIADKKRNRTPWLMQPSRYLHSKASTINAFPVHDRKHKELKQDKVGNRVQLSTLPLLCQHKKIIILDQGFLKRIRVL